MREIEAVLILLLLTAAAVILGTIISLGAALTEIALSLAT